MTLGLWQCPAPRTSAAPAVARGGWSLWEPGPGKACRDIPPRLAASGTLLPDLEGKRFRLTVFQNTPVHDLEARFEWVPRSIAAIIQEIDEPAVLKVLLKKAVTIDSLASLRRLLSEVLE
jgi:hypothetical protein